MVGRCLVLILAFTLVTVTPVAFAAPNDQGTSTVTAGPRKHLANIVFAGLAGAVLGLSTLSFYGRPQDRLSNIAVGFAIGVIGGTMFSTYKAAAEPREFYGTDNRFDFKKDPTPLASYTFEF